jgi:flagellar motility protein MotE (MotC chaperone)
MKSKLYFGIGCAILLLLAASVVAEETDKAAPVKQAAEKAKAADPVKAGTPIALTVEAIQELEDRKNALDAREKIMNERAKAFEIQEKVLRDKLRRIEELNAKMAERLEGFKKDHEEKVGKLVAVVETMKPQAAAAYVEQLDPDLAVAILTRIQVQKAAKIMNLVDKKLSARLTEMYTGYRDKIRDEVPPAAAATEPQSAKEALPNNTGKM